MPNRRQFVLEDMLCTRQANLFTEKHDCNTRTVGKIQVVSNTRRASFIKHQRLVITILSTIAIMKSEKTCKWRLKDCAVHCAECTFVLDVSLHRFASNCNISFANFYAVCSHNTIDHFIEP